MKLNVISFADSLIKILIVLIIDIPFIEVSFLFFILSSLNELVHHFMVLRLRLRMLAPASPSLAHLVLLIIDIPFIEVSLNDVSFNKKN